jgi:hypothetical protein
MKQIVLLVVSLFLVLIMPLVAAAGDVNISIGISAPPLVFTGPPDVVVVPIGPSYVYMVPDMIGLYFYNGYWYRFYENYWFRSTIYSGPWAYIQTSRVPRVIVNVPPDYFRHMPPGYHRIHYGDLHRNWRTWDKSRYWHRYDWYKRELKAHERRRHSDLQRPSRVVPHRHQGQKHQPHEQR